MIFVHTPAYLPSDIIFLVPVRLQTASDRIRLQEYFRGFLELLKFQHEDGIPWPWHHMAPMADASHSNHSTGRLWLVKVNKGYLNRSEILFVQYHMMSYHLAWVKIGFPTFDGFPLNMAKI